MIEGKVCTKCREYKLQCEYYKAKAKKLGVQGDCKQCAKIVKQKHYQNNKEKYRLAYLGFVERNPTYQHEYRSRKKTPS